MSAFDEKLELYYAEANKLKISVEKDLLNAVAKGLGPSIYNEDSALVSTSDFQELERLKSNFLIGKLGLSEGPHLDVAIKDVTNVFGSSNRNKHRALFYYLLVKAFKKESVYQ